MEQHLFYCPNSLGSYSGYMGDVRRYLTSVLRASEKVGELELLIDWGKSAASHKNEGSLRRMREEVLILRDAVLERGFRVSDCSVEPVWVPDEKEGKPPPFQKLAEAISGSRRYHVQVVVDPRAFTRWLKGENV